VQWIGFWCEDCAASTISTEENDRWTPAEWDSMELVIFNFRNNGFWFNKWLTLHALVIRYSNQKTINYSWIFATLTVYETERLTDDSEHGTNKNFQSYTNSRFVQTHHDMVMLFWRMRIPIRMMSTISVRLHCLINISHYELSQCNPNKSLQIQSKSASENRAVNWAYCSPRTGSAHLGSDRGLQL